MDDSAFELAYERKITSALGVELSLGYFKSDKTYHYRYSAILFIPDSSKIEIENYYFSPSLKYYLYAS